MNGIRWLVNGVVIVGMAYLTFAMTLAGWVAGLRKGQAVTLLPEQSTRTRNLSLQLGLVAVSLAVCAGLIYLLWIPVPVVLPPITSQVLIWIGLAFFVAGALLVVWARHTLGKMWGISTSREVKLLPDHQLVKDGPYSVIRHPMYFGWWIAVVGTILIYRTWILILLFVFSVVVFARRARLEEKVLAARFGQEWEAYAAATRSLVPFIY
jgi:protein-S-isoprenylcysteine O-methyltransferase Ste14